MAGKQDSNLSRGEEHMSPLERALFLGFMAVAGVLLLSFAYGLWLSL